VLRIRYDADPDFCAILHFVGNLDKELAAIDQLLSDEKLLKLIEVIQAETLKQFNQQVTAYATQLQITQGKKMRTDGTVVTTNIHFPSDNSLLVDGVRVLTRLLQQARKLLLQHNCSVNAQLFRNRNRTARRISRRIDSYICLHLKILATEITCPHCSKLTGELHQVRPILVFM
jgi:IS5 family transposase